MHYNWYYTAIKGLIGQLGKQLYKKLSKSEQKRLARCLDRIEDKKDLIESAKCIVEPAKGIWLKLNQQGSDFYKKLVKRDTQGLEENEDSKFLYGLDGEDRIFKRTKSTADDQSMLKVQSKGKMDNLVARNDKSAISRISQLIHQLTGPNTKNETMATKQTWSKTFGTLKKLHNLDKERRKTLVIRYDLVLDSNETSLSPSEKRSPMGMLRTALQLIDSLPDRENKTEKDYRAFSPRFMPIMPDKSDSEVENVFSPNILCSLHDTSVPLAKSKTTLLISKTLRHFLE
uniref:Uncharacterized protein n=1 Tax=Ditylenchus dipsaci TaxID=166011 RepID=A0A915CVZ9_9BILA